MVLRLPAHPEFVAYGLSFCHELRCTPKVSASAEHNREEEATPAERDLVLELIRERESVAFKNNGLSQPSLGDAREGNGQGHAEHLFGVIEVASDCECLRKVGFCLIEVSLEHRNPAKVGEGNIDGLAKLASESDRLSEE